jgi:hypothetical protein
MRTAPGVTITALNYDVLRPRLKSISCQSHANRRPTFSSQEYMNEEWEKTVAEELDAQPKSSQVGSNPKSSQGSSQYDDPELVSLMEHFSL